MGETQDNRVTPPNGGNPHLIYHLQLKTKEDAGGSGWDFEGMEGNSHEDGKANVWCTTVCWALQRQWDPAGTLVSRSCAHCTEPILSADVSGDSSILGTGPLSEFFLSVGRRSEFLPEFWCLDCFHLDIIHMPKRHLEVAKFASL